MRIRILASVLAAATATVLAAGCANTPADPAGPSATSADPSVGVSAEHNPADITFVQDMIPHHTQAIAMSSQAPRRAASPQVKDLADRIDRGQGPEIEQMNQMLAAWGAPRPQPGSTPTVGAMGGMSMSGMMTDQQMNQLAALSGPAFDRTFLAMMTAHHRGAVIMAQTELAAGQNPQAKALARAIITAQQAEIAEMARLLGQS